MLKKEDISDFAPLCAVILAVGQYNFERFSSLNSFGKITKEIFGREFADFWEFQKEREEFIAQLGICDEAFSERLFGAYDELLNSGVIGEREMKELRAFFTSVCMINKSAPSMGAQNEQTPIKSPQNFADKISLLFDLIEELEKLNESKLLRQKIAHVREALDKRSFSIGVTGVMNAGKSTLLNSLLKADILGTAVVPETANLTLLKYSQNPKAVVNFWSEEQWRDIEKSGEFLPQIAKFTADTKAKFGSDLSDFIVQNGKSVTINPDDLSLYTSALKSDMKCNLVQSVELYTPLEFLKDGVVIVDTPGLDDPVTKREEITREYLSKCDLMMHLMNANQSATAKDVDFIIDALTYQGISRLLVVITRIDTITKDELSEVIEYTKKSIKAQLDRHNKGAIFDALIEKIEFIPIAAKLALLHRTGRADEALKLGYSEADTGIFEIERYLSQTLFGADSPKANLLIESASKNLRLVCDECIRVGERESENLGKSADELKTELLRLQSQNAQKERLIEEIFAALNSEKAELSRYCGALLSDVGGKSAALKNRLFARLYDDVKYELNKHGKKPANERLEYMIESCVKDGLVDAARDFRFGFAKQTNLAQEKLALMFEDLRFEDAPQIFDVKAFFESQNEKLNLNFDTLKSRVLQAVKNCQKSSIEAFANILDAILDDEFQSVNSYLENLLQVLSAGLLGEFTAQNEQPLQNAKERLNEEIESLKMQLELLSEHSQNAQKRREILRDKIAALKSMREKLALIGGAK